MLVLCKTVNKKEVLAAWFSFLLIDRGTKPINVEIPLNTLVIICILHQFHYLGVPNIPACASPVRADHLIRLDRDIFSTPRAANSSIRIHMKGNFLSVEHLFSPLVWALCLFVGNVCADPCVIPEYCLHWSLCNLWEWSALILVGPPAIPVWPLSIAYTCPAVIIEKCLQ